MKKGIKITGLVGGIIVALFAFIGLIAVIITAVQGGLFPIVTLILCLVELTAGVMLCFGALKEKSLITLIASLLAFVIVLLDVVAVGSGFSATGWLLAGFVGLTMLTVVSVIGYLTIALIAVVAVLQIVDMVTNK